MRTHTYLAHSAAVYFCHQVLWLGLSKTKILAWCVMIGQTRQLRPAQAPSFTSVNIPGCKQVAACDHYLQGPEREKAGKETVGNTSIACFGKSKSLCGCVLPTSQTPIRIGTVVGCHCWVRKKTEERLQIEFSNQGRWSVWSWTLLSRLQNKCVAQPCEQIVWWWSTGADVGDVDVC